MSQPGLQERNGGRTAQHAGLWREDVRRVWCDVFVLECGAGGGGNAALEGSGRIIVLHHPRGWVMLRYRIARPPFEETGTTMACVRNLVNMISARGNFRCGEVQMEEISPEANNDLQ